MKKSHLLVLGAVAVGAYLLYNHHKSTGKWLNASGTTGKLANFPGRCQACRTVSGGTYVPPQGYNCDFSAGDRCISIK